MKTTATVLIMTFLACGLAYSAPNGKYERSVVGLSVTHQDWDEDRPWAKRNPKARHATGVIVDGPYILTTAQMVSNATYIQIEKFGRATQYETRAFLVDREVDLALLEVDDPAFFEDLEPVTLARETPVAGALEVVRWNNQQFESLESSAKRFEVQESYFGRLHHVFLIMQTDLSGGGWAEPVFEKGKLVGITASQNEEHGRVIPVEVLFAFLDKAGTPGSYDSFPVFRATWQVNEDRSLSAYLGQTGGPRGILIRQVPWGSSACGVLKPLDILLSVDGQEIDAGGYYTHPRLGRLEFTNIVIDGHEIGDVVPVKALRDGKVIDLEMTLRGYPVEMALCPVRRGDRPPPYVVAGGLVFRELDGDYLRSWGKDWNVNAPVHLLTSYYLDREGQAPGRRRIILLTSVLPSPYNIGYQGLRDMVVDRINGRRIDSIPAVVEAFNNQVDRFHTITLAPNVERSDIVLDAGYFEPATMEILETYRIPAAVRLPSAPLPDPGPACPGDY